MNAGHLQTTINAICVAYTLLQTEVSTCLAMCGQPIAAILINSFRRINLKLPHLISDPEVSARLEELRQGAEQQERDGTLINEEDFEDLQDGVDEKKSFDPYDYEHSFWEWNSCY